MLLVVVMRMHVQHVLQHVYVLGQGMTLVLSQRRNFHDQGLFSPLNFE